MLLFSSMTVNFKVEVILIYGLCWLLALFTTIFQTAGTLYFLCVCDSYAKAGAQSAT